MSTVEVSREDVIRRLESIIARDPDAGAALYAPDAVRYDPATPQGMRGREAIRKYQEMLAKASNDVQARTVSVVSKGDTVAWEWVFTGTLTGPFELPTGTVPPTNRQATLHGATFYRFNREGLRVEQHDYRDNISLMQQFGIKPKS